MKVSIVPEMLQKGIENNKKFKDYQFLDRRQKDAVDKFIEYVANDMDLEGKNKSSWQNDDYADISDAYIFKQFASWHYHSGPTYSRPTFIKTVRLEFNPNGRTSSEVVHYRKLSDDHILITAFSPEHIPFPPALSNSAILRLSEEERLLQLAILIKSDS